MPNTIFALSSGAPPAAIAVIRISGPDADAALLALAGSLPKPRRSRLATLRRGADELDRALVQRFPGPNSATGEDIAELHLHGGRAVVAAVEAALGELPGLRRAEPGEFTRRAFANGRIDLAEAEGLADLLQAEAESQRRAALALAGGALSRQVEAWRLRLLGLSAELEAAIDFSDEGDVAPRSAGVADRLGALIGELTTWLDRPTAERLKEGIRVVVAGPPNSGKSTIINALSGRDVAITSEIAGTTRDLIEAPTSLAGTPFLLIDTAGLRVSDDRIESIGVARAQASVEAADLILWLGEPEAMPDRTRTILVHAKSDLGSPDSRSDLAVSALTGAGMAELVDEILDRSRALLPVEGEVALHRRHQVILHEVVDYLSEMSGSSDPIVQAELLRGARGLLDRITGRAGVEDVLDTLFARFCIGK